jgi:hypothetical protein
MEYLTFFTCFEHYCSRQLLRLLEKLLKPLLFAHWLFVWRNPVSSWLTMPGFWNGYDFLSWYQKLYFLTALYDSTFFVYEKAAYNCHSWRCKKGTQTPLPFWGIPEYDIFSFSFRAVEMISNYFWTKISVTVTMPKTIFQVIRIKWKNFGDREYGVY